MIRGLVFVLLLSALAACSSPPDHIIGVDNPATPAAMVDGTTLQTIYIATTRQEADDPTLLYSADREPVGLNFAKVVVSIPPTRDVGTVTRPSSLPPDPKTDFVLLDPVTYYNQTTFKSALNRSLRERPATGREILLFVHGYNTDLPEAIMRTAQFAYDSGFKGIPIVFAWPSRGRTLQYVYDLNSALHARDDLIVAAELAASTQASGLNLVAHSMGNLLTVEAMRQDQLLGGSNNSRKIRSIVLASPDIDAELFAKQLQPFPKEARKFYVLISANDKALAVSRRLAGGIDRVGDERADDLARLGVTVIDLTKIDDTSSLNHTKFADAPEIVRLIGQRMNEGDSFVQRPGRAALQAIPDAVSVLTGRGQSVIAFP
ncbi:esterase/lipase superfamily enzyme [Roseibium hamelinense]|uniref:Esterase/lipase superfamily enzyme n=1 Tax=Roseibium hamelinense TaxID=150831 RepID=A0A562SG48_9HYPH|nr:alpha/beta fold hydrolase [Roseibium hamelinense]MTI42196.1 alpha/beta fold hydrolase [Roseibium hamelinense]TWI79530.1 esterase/lipase superfamily enzyme [Roseibium hamelinense]